ncbi:DUF3147 family protein [Zunongwangia profunda]|jgi:hypothetical protein|uniref:DUF3147 family protein n=1 Tax=Zunongwangia profunda TaxID=398743 RepID=UPI001D18FB31|nr:DUF3147 family protein [Zunongwangia profunda]MCC4227156.1 DUF3147 family protein [Zunongwangia profunda]
MEQDFIIKVVLSLIVGGIWVASSTVVVDKFGTKVGGLIAGLPSTVVIALFFIGLNQGVESVVASTSVVPLAFAANGPFMLVYAALSKKGLWLSMGAALLVWFGISYLIILLDFNNFSWGLGICIVVLIVSTIIFEKTFSALSVVGQKTEYKGLNLLARALFAGIIIGAAVLASKFLSPLFGGILASFPAVFVSTLIILHKSRGAKIAIGLAKALLISGFINVMSYIIAIRLLYTSVGIYWGTLIGLLISLATAYVTHQFILKKLK